MKSYRNSEPRPPIMRGAPPPPEWRPPRNEWDRPPWNRWSFQNVSQILPTAEIRRGDTITPWREAPKDILGVEFEAGVGRALTIAEMLDDTYTDGFLVAKGGAIVHESYYNGMDRRTRHLAQSVSKSIIGATAGALIGEGLLDPARPVTDHLPELAATAWKGATLRHVMDMTSGVKYVEDYEAPDSDIARTDVAAGWRLRPEGADPADWPGCMWDQIVSLTERDAEHGERWSYRSIETDVLGFAISRVARRPLAEVISDRLWAPMGAEEDALATVDSAGAALADGGICATLRDFARFGQTMLDRGAANGRQVIPAAFVDDVRQGDHGLFNAEGREHMANGVYRNQFWIEDRDRATHLSLGVFGQMIHVSPEHDMVTVKLSTWPDFTNPARSADTLRAVHAIAAAL